MSMWKVPDYPVQRDRLWQWFKPRYIVERGEVHSLTLHDICEFAAERGVGVAQSTLGRRRTHK